MVPHSHQINTSGTCNTCQTVANKDHILECYDCKTKYHAQCGTAAPFACKTFVNTFKGIQKNSSNFLFICDHCITNRENTEAAALKEHMAEVVASVSRLAKEVSELKTARSEPTVEEAGAKPVSGNVDNQNKTKPPAWTDPKETDRIIKQKESKVTLCIKNDDQNAVIDLKKVKNVVTSHGIQITNASVNRKNGDLYVDLPSTEEREKLVPLLKDEVIPGNTIVNVKKKCPVITIKNVSDYVNEEEFISRIKAQNRKIGEQIDKNGSEFTVVFAKELNPKPRPTALVEDENSKLFQIVARVSEDIRRSLKSDNDKLFIGLTSHHVFDRFYVKSCAKCHRFDHYHAECQGKACCGFCSAEDHDSNNCPIHAQ